MEQSRAIDLNAIALHAMMKYGFEPRFPKPVQREVDAIEEEAIHSGTKEARDLRTLLWSSIDNYDSMDLDQLEYCERGPEGEIHVKVAIADVDFFVPKDSQTDLHASHNGTSVYTGIETFPMLPDKLSKGITSLLPGRERLAIVVEYSILRDGGIRHGDVYRARVVNKAKLVYEALGDWLEGTSAIPREVSETQGLEAQIRVQNEAMELLKKFRIARGALDLDTLEAQAVVENGSVKDIIVQKKNMARSIIEEFMVAANGNMVAFLGEAGIPILERVVRIPKNWEGIVKTAAVYGEKLPSEPDSIVLSKFLMRRREADPERFPDLSLTIVKLLGSGEYMMLEPESPSTGHFALAVTDYTHATAPNRRFVDLINQRLVKSVLDRTPGPYSKNELSRFSSWLTDRDKASNKVERFMRKAAAAVLLRDLVGRSFDALVTGASVKGTYVRLIAPPAEGRVVRHERGLSVGDKVRVRLLKTDPYNGFIDFERI